MLTTILAANYARFHNFSFFKNLHKSFAVNRLTSKNSSFAESKINLK